MAVGDMLTEDYDIEFDGVLLVGDSHREHVEFNIFDSPEVRVSDLLRGRIDGQFPGVDLYAGRTFVLAVEVWGETEAEFYESYRGLLDAVKLRRTELPMAFRLPGWSTDLVIYCRPRRVSGPVIDYEFEFFKGTVQIQFHATDPRIYGLVEQSGNAAIQITTLGMTFDATFDLTFGGLNTSNTINAVNDGNYEAPWEATITGPVANPRIEHVEQGKILQFNGTLADGEILVVQSKPRANVLLAGMASRYHWLVDSSQWFMLDPGLNSIRFQGSTAGTPSLQFTWRSAWV